MHCLSRTIHKIVIIIVELLISGTHFYFSILVGSKLHLVFKNFIDLYKNKANYGCINTSLNTHQLNSYKSFFCININGFVAEWNIYPVETCTLKFIYLCNKIFFFRILFTFAQL